MGEQYIRFSPTKRSSSFVDDCRDAREDAAKEFDQFYGYIAKALTPTRSPRQPCAKKDRAMIHKSTPKRLPRQNVSTLLTPMMEQLVTDNSRHLFDETNNRHVLSPSRYPNYPPPRPMTLSPTSVQTPNSNSSLFFQQQDEDDISAIVYLRSPERLAPSPPSPIRKSQYTSGITCPSSPSILIRDQLIDESRRLKQLSHSILLVQQQSFALTKSKKVIRTTANQQRLFLDRSRRQKEDGNVSSPFQSTNNSKDASFPLRPYPTPNSIHPLGSVRKQSHSSPRPMFTTSTPLGSPILPHQSLDLPVFLSNSLSSTSNIPLIPKTTTKSGPIPSSSPISSRSTAPQKVLNNTPSDIPKARLRSSEFITTPKGGRIENKFWEEIHHHVEKPSMSPSQEEEDSFWMTPQLTNRLHHVKTLDEELSLANDKYAQVQQKKKVQLNSKMFSLQPSHLIDLSPTTEQGVIDGDQWTFAGQHYTVKEKE
ncbi:hypothetical protein BC941DRAFT_442483 [Chlamydoabsidia padenii]|nr:hypothetical protein BC941DRAFT_442483 [Chlamydoabsidia padenii]